MCDDFLILPVAERLSLCWLSKLKNDAGLSFSLSFTARVKVLRG